MLDAVHIIGQILFGGYFIYSGINHFLNRKDYTVYAEVNKVPQPATAVYLTGVLLLLGGLGVLFNLYINIALTLLIIFLIPVTFTMHAFWKGDNTAEKSSQKIAFMKNVALLGATLLLF